MPKVAITKKDVIDWAEKTFEKPFTRGEWNKRTGRPVSGSTIHNWFGSWEGFLSEIRFISSERDEVIKWCKSMFPLGVTREQWDCHPERPFHSDTIHRWFGSWSKFIQEAVGRTNRVPKNISDDELRDWIISTVIVDDNGCWNARSGNPYGRIFLGKKHLALHRVSYELFVGEIPSGLILRHTCDNKLCCNPDHLVPGTRRDNSNDFYERNNSSWDRYPNGRRRNGMIDSEIYEWLMSNTYMEGKCRIHTNVRRSGYINFQIKGKNWLAHRFVRCHLDGLPHDHPLMVRHVCGNRACLNPDHLVWGTAKQNRLDDIRSGKNRKLTSNDILAIRTQWANTGMTKTEFDKRMAARFGVSTGTIRNIRIGATFQS